jgi:hypothetical protein
VGLLDLERGLAATRCREQAERDEADSAAAPQKISSRPNSTLDITRDICE